MSLADIVIPSEIIKFKSPDGKEESFEVTGLTIEGLVYLLQEDRENLASLFEGGIKDFNSALKFAPGFCSKLVASAAGEPGQFKKVAKLPVGVQLRALTKVWELTNFTAEELGNVFALLGEGLERFATEIELIKKLASEDSDPSMSGASDSKEPSST